MIKYMNLLAAKAKIEDISTDFEALTICIKETKNAMVTILKFPVDVIKSTVASNFQNTLREYYAKLNICNDELMSVSKTIQRFKSQDGADELFKQVEQIDKNLTVMSEEVLRLYKQCEKYQNSKITNTNKEIKEKLKITY